MNTQIQVINQVLHLLGKVNTLEVTDEFSYEALEDFRVTYVYAEELGEIIYKGRMALVQRDTEKLSNVLRQLIKHPAFKHDGSRKVLADCIELMHEGRLLLLTSMPVRKILLACHKSIQNHLGILIIKGEIRFHLMQASIEELA